MLLLASSDCGLFKWRQFEPEVILLAVGWYLRFSLSYRDVEELLAERGLLVDHVTVWRWVQSYAPELNRRLRSGFKPTNDSWRVDSDLYPRQGKVGVFIPGCRLQRCFQSTSSSRPNAMRRRPSAFSARLWAMRTIQRRGSSTRTRTQLTRRQSSN